MDFAQTTVCFAVLRSKMPVAPTGKQNDVKKETPIEGVSFFGAADRDLNLAFAHRCCVYRSFFEAQKRVDRKAFDDRLDMHYQRDQ